MTSQLDAINDIQKSLDGVKETCVLCHKMEGMSCYSDRKDIVQNLVKHSFLSPLGFKNCTQKTHELTKYYKEELSNVIHFIWQSLEQCKRDFHNMGFGFNAVDVDINRPTELIKLFLDLDSMEFVSKRYYDLKIERNEFGGGGIIVYDDKIWKGHTVIESGSYLEDKARFITSYRNAINIFESIDKEWLALLDPEQYDWFKTIPEARARHFGFVIENIDKNMQFVNEDREKYKQWLVKAEDELGRKLVYKSMEIIAQGPGFKL